jgi:4-hydroxybenzoate polyprenyltransferase
MAIARHGDGVAGAARALGSQIHPVFMLPPVASSLFGAALVGEFSLDLAALHAAATFCGVYTAHVKDGYVDFHVRGEDDDHPLTVLGCRLALVGAGLGFLAVTLALWGLAGPAAAAVTLPGWVVGYLHAPQLDTNPVTATGGYPGGIALALFGGAYVQAESVVPVAAAFALVFFLTLSGIKAIDDAKDYDYDRSIDKRTVAVVFGREGARRVAYGLMALGMGGVAVAAFSGVFPVGTLVAAGAFALVAGLSARTTDPELATMLLIRGSYVFLAVLLVATWWRPLG